MTLLSAGFQGGYPYTTGSLNQLSLTGAVVTYNLVTAPVIDWNATIVTAPWASVSSGVITISTKATYSIAATLGLSPIIVQTNIYAILIKVDGSPYYYGPSGYSNGSENISIAGSTTLSLNAGQSVSVSVYSTTSTSVDIVPGEPQCVFSMYLLSGTT